MNCIIFLILVRSFSLSLLRSEKSSLLCFLDFDCHMNCMKCSHSFPLFKSFASVHVPILLIFFKDSSSAILLNIFSYFLDVSLSLLWLLLLFLIYNSIINGWGLFEKWTWKPYIILYINFYLSDWLSLVTLVWLQ